MDESPALVHQVSNESRTSITESLSEFFDAQEVLLSASSSENEVRDGSKAVCIAGSQQCPENRWNGAAPCSNELMLRDVVDEIMVIAAGASAATRML